MFYARIKTDAHARGMCIRGVVSKVQAESQVARGNCIRLMQVSIDIEINLSLWKTVKRIERRGNFHSIIINSDYHNETRVNY